MSDELRYLLLETWAGKMKVPVKILGETPKKYRVQFFAQAWLPGGRRVKPGEVRLVPKSAILSDNEPTKKENG